MYSEEQIKEIVKENNFLTKVCHSWEDSCLILVPNFKEYHFLFGEGRTRTCYASSEVYWDYHHKNIFREIDFLSVSNDIVEQYKYITFCLEIDKINWGRYNEGGNGVISGFIEIYDFNHYNYSFSFSTRFHESLLYDKQPYINEEFIEVNLNTNIRKDYFISSVKFVDFCGGFGENGVMPTVIKIGCTDILKKAIEDGISNK